MTFLLDEDQALREHLQGMVVHDQKADGSSTERPVGVWFGQPDQELREQRYPYVTIDLIDVQKDVQREMRGYGEVADYRNPGDLLSNQAYKDNLPIPVSIDYQVTSYSRHPRHDREIITQLTFEKLPFRFGILELNDGTVRRMDVLDISKRDVTEQAKRLFVNNVTVRVSSEVAQGQLKTLYKVSSVNLDTLSALPANGRPGNPDFMSVEPFITSS
jgi:hypothetical protein